MSLPLRSPLFILLLVIFSCRSENELEVYFETSSMPKAENIFTRTYIKQAARVVCNWQINHPVDMPEDNDWARSTFLLGVLSTYKITQNEDYLTYCLAWSHRNKWRLSNHSHPANNLLCAKVYLELMEIVNISDRSQAIQEEIMRIKNDNIPGRQEWHWSDAFFMAPPSIIHYHNRFDPKGDYDQFYEMWWDAHTHLYSLSDSLYYRDERFINSRTFWLRGNGWVIAGIAKTLEQLPKEHPEYKNLSQVFIELAEKLKKIQNSEGLWASDLLKKDKPSETSGSALICYALAWGVNHGILKKEDYYSCIETVWKGIVSKIHSDGRVGWVQARGDRPVKISPEDYQEYGAGAVLLAAYELYELFE